MPPTNDSVSGLGNAYPVGGSIPANDRKRRGGGRKGRPKRSRRPGREHAPAPADAPAEEAGHDPIGPDADTQADGQDEGGEGHVNYLA